MLGGRMRLDLREGAYWVRRPVVYAESVRGDLHRDPAATAAYHQAGGMQGNRVLIRAGGGPINNQFHVSTHRKLPAAAEAHSRGTHVMKRTGTPTGWEVP
jgi:hypothetical protein